MGGGGGAVFLQNVVNTKPLLFFRLKKLSSGVSKLRKTVSYKNRMRVVVNLLERKLAKRNSVQCLNDNKKLRLRHFLPTLTFGIFSFF